MHITRRKILVAIVITVVILVAGFILFGVIKPQRAGIVIESDPQAIVFVDGEQIGRTPLRTDLSPKEVAIRLVPESFDKPRIPYHTKVELVAGIQTVIRRVLGENSQQSAGEVISFKKIGGSEASISIVSAPDGSSVKLDGVVRGTAPLNIGEIDPGNHALTISALGFMERNFTIKAEKGYRITAVVNLAESEGKQEQLLPTPQPSAAPEQVEILKTPLGFLRVRSEPNITSEEVVRVKPGDKFTLLEIDKDTGWFKIKLSEEKEGWVSNEYASLSATVFRRE